MKKQIFLSLIMVVALLLPQTLRADVVFNEENFPDPNFRQYLKDNKGFPAEGVTVTTASLTSIKTINCYKKGVAILKGIEYFTALTRLECENNQLTELDVTKNTALTHLQCENNQLTELKLPNTTALTALYCYNNQLTELDVTKNTALTILHCHTNQLTELDVTKNTALTSLHCNSNQLTELDVTKNTALTSLTCYNNQLSELNVTKNTALRQLWCYGNQLSDLDVTKNTALTDLNCEKNQLTELDVTKNTALDQLFCGYNQLTELDVTKNTVLRQLSCPYNHLAELTLPNTTTLTNLICDNNRLTELDVTKNTALTGLFCYSNQLTELVVTHNTALNWLSCSSNQLTELTLPNTTTLTRLECSSNRLTALDLSANTALTRLSYSNQTRDIGAESTEIPVVKNGQTVYKKCYYLRLDNNKTGEEKTIVERMTETNHGGVESSFDPGRVLRWISGGTIIEGTKRAASVGEVTPDMVYGTILMLTNVTESGDVASGTVNYKYNVQNTLDSDGSKGGFTLRWTASAKSGVVTGVLRLGDGVEVPVSEVQFVNPAGQVSDHPWPGVNIVVKRYSDGTVTTSKQLQ